MASGINTCTFTGNVGKDPESFEYGGDKRGARFSIAVRLQNDKTAWIPLSCFGQLAEKVVLPYVSKGMKLTVVCSYEPNTREVDGKNVTYPGFVLRDVDLPPKGQQSSSEPSAPPAPATPDDAMPF